MSYERATQTPSHWRSHESSTQPPKKRAYKPAVKCTGVLRNVVRVITKTGSELHRLHIEILDGEFAGMVAHRDCYRHTTKSAVCTAKDMVKFGVGSPEALIASLNSHEYRLEVEVCWEGEGDYEHLGVPRLEVIEVVETGTAAEEVQIGPAGGSVPF